MQDTFEESEDSCMYNSLHATYNVHVWDLKYTFVVSEKSLHVIFFFTCMPLTIHVWDIKYIFGVEPRID